MRPAIFYIGGRQRVYLFTPVSLLSSDANAHRYNHMYYPHTAQTLRSKWTWRPNRRLGAKGSYLPL